MIKYFLYGILFLSLSGALATIWILIILKFFGNKVSHCFKYYIWMIALVMFLIPVRFNLINVSEVQSVITEQLPKTQVQPMISAPNTEIAEAAPNEIVEIKQNIKLDVFNVLFALWLAGLIFAAVKKSVIKRKFRCTLNKISFAPTNEFTEIFNKQVAEMGISQKVGLKVVDGEFSPFVTGIIHPAVIIPSDLSIVDLPFVLSHELVHIKRLDLLYMFAVSVIKSIHWFNPTVYFMAACINKEMEYSCDEQAIAQLGTEQRKSYSTAVLNSMKNNSFGRKCGAFLSEDGKNVKKRLEAIMKNRKTARAVSVILLLVLLVITTFGASAVNENNPADNAYVINKVKDDGGYNYNIKNESNVIDNVEKPLGETEREAVLINSPFYKSFYCIVKSEGSQINHRFFINGQKRIPVSETEGLQLLDVRMEKFVKSICGGDIWCGYFSVYRNGTPIIENCYGNITNVPNGNNRGLTDLILENGFYITNLNFGLKGDSIINSTYETDSVRRALYESEDTLDIWLEPQKLIYKGKEVPVPTENYEHSVSINRRLSLINIFLYVENVGYIGTDYSNYRYITEDNSIVADITVHANVTDEFNGEIRGLDGRVGDTVVFDYGEDFYGAFTISKIEDTPDETFSLSDNSEMIRTGKNKIRAVKLQHLPFDIRLSADKKWVEVTVKESYDYWYVAAADYGFAPYGNMFEVKTSETDGNTLIFPVVAENISHNIQARFESHLPYARKWDYDVMLRVVDGEILYTNCSENTFENESYSGEAAENEFKLSRRKS